MSSPCLDKINYCGISNYKKSDFFTKAAIHLHDILQVYLTEACPHPIDASVLQFG